MLCVVPRVLQMAGTEYQMSTYLLREVVHDADGVVDGLEIPDICTYLLREVVHGADGLVDAVWVPDGEEEAADGDDHGQDGVRDRLVRRVLLQLQNHFSKKVIIFFSKWRD